MPGRRNEEMESSKCITPFKPVPFFEQGMPGRRNEEMESSKIYHTLQTDSLLFFERGTSGRRNEEIEL